VYYVKVNTDSTVPAVGTKVSSTATELPLSSRSRDGFVRFWFICCSAFCQQVFPLFLFKILSPLDFGDNLSQNIIKRCRYNTLKNTIFKKLHQLMHFVKKTSGFSCSLTWAANGCIVRCGFTSSCQLAATSNIAKAILVRRLSSVISTV